MKGIRISVLLAFALLAPALPAAAEGSDPDPDSVAWHVRAAENQAWSRARGLDLLANPNYQGRFLPLGARSLTGEGPVWEVGTDPYRFDWAPARGQHVPVSYPNRYGAIIRAALWLPHLPFTDPVTGRETAGPLPTVLIVNGTDAVHEQYLSLAQGLAERGYAVMTFDPQGQGGSETDPNPTSVYCDPDGAWREPQELGVREEGECAGEVRRWGAGDPTYEARFYLDQRLNGPDYTKFEAHYPLAHARYIFGAFDAAAWLLSDANPQRELIDETRLGIAGHSLGAHAALNVGNGDPAARFKAVVAWDTFGPLLETVSPTVPTMIHHSDREEWYGPYREEPDPDSLPGAGWSARFRMAEIDVSQVVLRGSTHFEWGYIPNPFANPFCRPVCTASRLGERVALYFTLAWFDTHLKGGDAGHAGDGKPNAPRRWRAAHLPQPQRHHRDDVAAQRADGRRRMLADVFDDSVDGSSIGHGTWDPLTGQNVPYTIAGEEVTDHLSFYYRSSYAFDGAECDDWRAGCQREDRSAPDLSPHAPRGFMR